MTIKLIFTLLSGLGFALQSSLEIIFIGNYPFETSDLFFQLLHSSMIAEITLFLVLTDKLLKEQSDQGLHCIQFNLNVFMGYLMSLCLSFRVMYANFWETKFL